MPTPTRPLPRSRAHPRKRARAAALLASLALLASCAAPAPTGALQRDPACKLTGPLAVSLGQGVDPAGFTLLQPGEEPAAHHGAQGGQHLILGLRVDNAAPRSPGFWVKFEVERARCGGTDAGCGGWELIGQYQTTVRPTDPRLSMDGEAATVSGFIIVLSDWQRWDARRLRAEAEDPCGRTGAATLELPATPVP
jgi:hypothetical protein